MIDEREQFGRVVRGFAPPNDAFERFVDRKGRKQRNRRIRAGALGVIVALAVGIFFVRSLTSDSVPANPPVEPAPAPLSGAIAYDLQGQIHVAGLDGSNPVAIEDVVTVDDECSGTVYTMHPVMVADGRYLAFNRTCDDPGLIEVVIADLQGNVVESFRVAQAYPQERSRGRPTPPASRCGTSSTARGHVHDRRATGSTAPVRRRSRCLPDGSRPTAAPPTWTPDGASLIVSELEVPLDGDTPREIRSTERSRIHPEGGGRARWPTRPTDPDGVRHAPRADGRASRWLRPS
jgi:hypothetical protein